MTRHHETLERLRVSPAGWTREKRLRTCHASLPVVLVMRCALNERTIQAGGRRRSLPTRSASRAQDLRSPIRRLQRRIVEDADQQRSAMAFFGTREGRGVPVPSASARWAPGIPSAVDDDIRDSAGGGSPRPAVRGHRLLPTIPRLVHRGVIKTCAEAKIVANLERSWRSGRSVGANVKVDEALHLSRDLKSHAGAQDLSCVAGQQLRCTQLPAAPSAG